MSSKCYYNCGSSDISKCIFGCETCTAQVLKRNGLQDDTCWSYYGPLPNCCCQTCKRQMDLLWHRRNCINFRQYRDVSFKCRPSSEPPCNNYQQLPVCKGGCRICGTCIPCIFQQKYTMDQCCQKSDRNILKESKSVGSLSLTLTLDYSTSSDDLRPGGNKPVDDCICEDKNGRIARRGTSTLNNPTACSKCEISTTETIQFVPCAESDLKCSSLSDPKFERVTNQISSKKHVPETCICKSEESLKYECHINQTKFSSKQKSSRKHICKHVSRKPISLSTRKVENKHIRSSSCSNADAMSNNHLVNAVHPESNQIPSQDFRYLCTCDKNPVCKYYGNIRMMYRRYMCLRPNSVCLKYVNPYFKMLCHNSKLRPSYEQTHERAEINKPVILPHLESLKRKQTKRNAKSTVKPIKNVIGNIETTGCRDRFVQTVCFNTKSVSSKSVMTPNTEAASKFEPEIFEKAPSKTIEKGLKCISCKIVDSSTVHEPFDSTCSCNNCGDTNSTERCIYNRKLDKEKCSLEDSIIERPSFQEEDSKAQLSSQDVCTCTKNGYECTESFGTVHKPFDSICCCSNCGDKNSSERCIYNTKLDEGNFSIEDTIMERPSIQKEDSKAQLSSQDVCICTKNGYECTESFGTVHKPFDSSCCCCNCGYKNSFVQCIYNKKLDKGKCSLEDSRIEKPSYLEDDSEPQFPLQNVF
ncbi:uncharacterized protein LOC130447573 isoform X3 [Diorhabda sublineata]|uniref:uncharacterized protein LOC130447573 isoform X3 n=1 Tax=Diorhabda sublineata TaxID=1163346 RepID=UPI0024E17CDB|nr:uncharacterized protein LOC130447573 isoform X3 [Diorhabda sublineata]